MNERRTYEIRLVVNGRDINEVVIDAHYEQKHSDINDPLILRLVETLNGREFQPEDRDDNWEFFMLDQIELEGKRYRLVWCMQDQRLFIGVVNCFRR